MKKLILILILVIVFFIGMNAQNDPFVSLLGMRWGINANEFKELFKDNFEGYKLLMNGFWRYIPDRIFLVEDFILGDEQIISISFEFVSKTKDLPFKSKTYSQFYLTSAEMRIDPDRFEPMLEILKAKYNQPKSTKEYRTVLDSIGGAEYRTRSGRTGGWNTKTPMEVTQKEVVWENDSRRITLYNFTNITNEGAVVFEPKIKEDTKKTADIL